MYSKNSLYLLTANISPNKITTHMCWLFTGCMYIYSESVLVALWKQINLCHFC